MLQASTPIEIATVAASAAIGELARETVVTDSGSRPSNAHANSTRDCCMKLQYVLSGQYSAYVNTWKIATSVLPTDADRRKKYVGDAAIAEGRPEDEFAADTNEVPNVCRKIAPNSATAATAATPARAIVFAVRIDRA